MTIKVAINGYGRIGRNIYVRCMNQIAIVKFKSLPLTTWAMCKLMHI